jgi:hypothetical protein
MASQLIVYREAAAILKNRPPVTVSDATEICRLFGYEYSNTLAYCLEQGLWNFALRSIELNSDASIDPQFGYTFAFEKPTDFVRLNGISGNGYFNPTIEEYLDEGSYWFASIDPLYVSYVSNGVTYGLDLGKWPATFQRYVAFELAARTAPHLTAMEPAEYKLLEQRRMMALSDARTKDAMNQPVSRPPPGRLVTARYGSRGGLGGTPWWR